MYANLDKYGIIIERTTSGVIMANFPTGFDEHPHILRPIDLQPKHAEHLEALNKSGFTVIAGLGREDVPALTEIAQQESIREYCPNDIKCRWGSEEMAEKQLAKAGGRGVLRLVARRTGATLGFGWTGASNEEEQQFLPVCENTFALRLHEAARGKKLGTPFTRVIVAGSMALWGARNIGLETWASNAPAVKTYLRAEAILVELKDDVRPVISREQFSHNNHRNDTRLFMQFPWSKKV